MAAGERDEAEAVIAKEWPLSATAIDNEDAAMVTRVRNRSKSWKSGLDGKKKKKQQKNVIIIYLSASLNTGCVCLCPYSVNTSSHRDNM